MVKEIKAITIDGKHITTKVFTTNKEANHILDALAGRKRKRR